MTSTRRRVLVVEDSATQAAALTLLLEQAGYETRIARRAERALEMLRDEPMDLVLSDVVMPGMDGYELCRQIRAVHDWRAIPVVLLTSLNDPLAIVRGLASGAEHYVTKPYEPSALLTRVAAVLARAHDENKIRPHPFTVELLGTSFTIGATKEHILELLVSSYSDLMHTSEAVREAARRARFLADVTELLSASLDVEQVLRSLARLVVPRIADVCAIDLLNEDGLTSQRIALVHTVSSDAIAEVAHRPVYTLSEPAQRAVALKHVQIIGDADADLLAAVLGATDTPDCVSSAERCSLAVVPLVGRHRVLALLHCIANSGKALDSDDTMRLLEDVARRAALAVENASLYAQAQQATRARDDVLAVVSHDLRNPINTIHMSSAFLLDVLKDDPPIATITTQLQVISRSTRRANALIQDLLDISRIDAGRLAVDAKTASGASLIADAALELGPLVTGSGLAFEHSWNGEDVELQADRGRIIQVFSNLVGNAVKFTVAGGSITMRGSATTGGAQFEVTDTGSGIEPDHLPHLFDRFWKANQGSRTGAGLGLSIVRGIIESHRGVLNVSSISGEGTTFTFTLPSALDAPANS